MGSLTQGVEAHAARWAQVCVTVLTTPYPYAAAHRSLSADDVDVTPERLHPAFHGSLDWHSSAHMQWSLVRLLTLAPDQVPLQAVDLLDQRLTPDALATEAAYLRAHPSYERPYGWAWAAMLAAATRACPQPHAAAWSRALEPLVDAVADLVLGWLPRQAYPVRHGVHSNTAFALALLVEAYDALQRPDVVAAVRQRALEWFGSDRDYASHWEPSGSDFLSPALSEAELVRRLLPPGELPAWRDGFLPGLAEGAHPRLLEVPEVRDRTDGHLVHLYGLALSRAWQLRALAATYDDGAPLLVQAADRQLDAALPEVTGGDFMSTHWLVSFALLAVTA